MGSVSAAEILNLGTYNELSFLATNHQYQTELKKKQRYKHSEPMKEECTDYF